MAHHPTGFSLVELSIVLVILGLLTGGILTGQSLIRAAELRSVSSDIQRHSTATFTFRDKYNAYPGDMRNASRFWGPLDGGDGEGADCFTLESGDKATCNGNGDGKIDRPTGAVTADYWHTGERYHAWVQLANAGLVEGRYTGRMDTAPSTESACTPGKNVPHSKSNNNGWLLAHLSKFTDNTSATAFMGTGGTNLLSLCEQGQAYSSLNPEQLWNIDMKMDDGKPGMGKIYTSKPGSPSSIGDCSTTTSAATAEYAVTNSGSKCWAIMSIE